MSKQSLGYALLAATLLAAPACGRNDQDSGVNRQNATATDRASHVTNDTDTADASRPGAVAGREDRATGTAGSVSREAEASTEAGPDAMITMKIQAKYASDDVVKGRNIDVDTASGVVTLKGDVDSRRQRDVAEQLARETEGVKRVVNDLKLATR
jgi:osmotically-inducible protein OsmY